MRFVPGILVALILASGCGNASESKTEVVESTSIEAGYVSILSDLTAIMNRRTEDPAAVLDAVRAYISSNRERISSEINRLNREFLDMDDDAREKYKASVSPRVEAAMEAYAEAQSSLRKRMTEAQRWELGEALMQLK